MEKIMGNTSKPHMNAGGCSNDFVFYSPQSLWLAFMALHNAAQKNEPDHTKLILRDQQTEEAVCASALKDVQRDILDILNRLYRSRRLLIDHLRVLHFYGRKGVAPRGWVPREARAATLWTQALEILTPVWRDKGYLRSADRLKWAAARAELSQMGALTHCDDKACQHHDDCMTGAVPPAYKCPPLMSDQGGANQWHSH